MPAKKSESARRRAKKWYPVITKQIFKSAEVGEIPAKAIGDLLHRKLTVSLMTLTRDFKHQDVHVTLQITSISGQVAEAEFFGYKLSAATIKRIVRRRTDRIDVRVVENTKNNIPVVMKLVAITLNNTYVNVQKKIRAKIEEFLRSYISKSTFIEVLEAVIQNKLQRELRKLVNKIYPVRTVVVREYRYLEPRALITSNKVTQVSKETETDENKEGKAEVKAEA